MTAQQMEAIRALRNEIHASSGSDPSFDTNRLRKADWAKRLDTLLSSLTTRSAAMPGIADALRCVDALIGEVNAAGEDQKKTPWMSQAWHRRKTWARWLRELRGYLERSQSQPSPADGKALDLGPHPRCNRCHGTGEEPNAQFRCPCRWSTSPLRPGSDAADGKAQEPV